MYKAALAVTGVIQGISHEKIYPELRLESLKSRRWYRRLSCMFRILKEEAPSYLVKLIFKIEEAVITRNNHITSYNSRTDCLKYSFFASTLNDWFNLDDNIRNSESISVFKSKSLCFIHPVQSNICNFFDPKGLKVLNRLRLGLSYLNQHRFRHKFEDCMNPSCSCSLEIEDTSLNLGHCNHFNHQPSVYHNFESMSDDTNFIRSLSF